MPYLECWTQMVHTSARFPNLTVGPIVLCQSYRNPGQLANMAATLQFLSGGKLIFGIGAGWKEDEYLAYDYEFSPPKRPARSTGRSARCHHGALDWRAGDGRGGALPGDRSDRAAGSRIRFRRS